MNQTLFILLLVLVLESHGILVVDEPYVSRTSTNLPLREAEPWNNFTNGERNLKRLSVDSTTISRQEEEDLNESSETVARNKVQRSSEAEEDSEEEPEGPPDHAIPYSEHEEPRNVSTKPKYVGPGEWAKPPKNSDVPLDFVPTKLYAQVRKTHTVRRLPRRKAIENAESEEEKESAARLREVVRNSKVNTVYTEEGYEDSAYDHAGHIRDADYQEDYARKLRERLHNRKKSGDDDDEDDDDGDATESKKYAKINPEELKDYEDYEDHKADSNVVNGREERKEGYPKVVAEEGIKRLQEDVEREVEDIEKGFEEQNSGNGEGSKENGERRRKTRKRKRPVSSEESKINHGENLGESRGIENVENYSTTMVPVATTTLKEDFASPSGSYQYETHENSPHSEENPTTISYSQLFWDYFKTRQIESTTIPPSPPLKSTTVSPDFLQASSVLGNANTEASYSVHGEEATTLFPVAESAIFGAKTFAPSQFLMDPEFVRKNDQNNHLPHLKETNVEDFWRPIIPNEPATTTDTQFLGTYDDKILNNDQGISFSNFVRNLDSKEETDKNLDSSLFNPSLNLLTNRKPRYKIAVRQKPKKPVEYGSKKSSILSSINEPQSENITPRSIPFNENYMKVLMHLKNQEKAKYRHPNSLQPSNFYPSVNLKNPNDLRRIRPPSHQKTRDYSNFHPRRPIENIYPGSQKSRQIRKNHQPRQTHPDSSKTIKRSSTRNRNLIPAVDLFPPVPHLIDDFARTKETSDYLTGNGSNQVRNLLRTFQRTGSIDPIAGIRAKRRERRSTSDGNGGDAKGSGLSANNDATNRYEIERTAKNSSIERNSLLKANSGPQVALVPDTFAEKRNDEKKSRSDRGKGSFQEGRAVERESNAGVDDPNPLRYNNDEWKRKDVVDEEESVTSGGSKKSHEDLLNESPKVTNDVIQKEIDARFNEKGEEEEDGQEDTEDDVEVEVPDFDYVEEIPEENRADNETAEPSAPIMDLEKYPFYNNEKVPTPSALRYAIDPERLPRKTYGGMEFYGSRDAYKHCEEVEPTLKVLPEKEEPVPDKGPEENLPRLRGLGDKLDCFKAKYFDNDPFDNPLFLEKEVEDPSPPEELGTKQFASRIMMFPKQNDDYVIQKSSRKPENYRRPRKPSSSTVRLPKSRRVLYRTVPGTGRGKRPRVYRVKGVRVKYVKGSRRPQKVIKRPVASASDMWSLYTPYQSQVYEDVMGTIRNMANSYQVYEVTTLPTSGEATVTAEVIDDIKTNVSGNSTTYRKKEKDKESINIVERPRKVDANIEGMMPPKYSNRQQTVYNRNRIPQRNKTRVQHWRKVPSGVRVNHRQKVRVYKRSVEESSSMEKRMHSTSEESNNSSGEVVRNDTDFLGRRNSTASDAVSRLIDAKRKSKVPKSVSNDDGDEKKEKQKVIYTINDRIRYSKPKGDVTRVGKFGNETEVEEDKRRREPKYNYIKRRRPLNSASTTTETPSLDSTDEINWTEASIPTATILNENIERSNKELGKENKETHFSLEDMKNENLNESTKLEEQDQISHSNKQPSNKTRIGYAVYENVNEDEESTTQAPHPETPSEFFNLKTFLETDPPGYAETSSDEFKKSLFSNNNSSDDFKFDPDSTNAKETENREAKDEDISFDHRSNEESSEKVDVQTSTESSEESDSKESDSEEHSTFFKYETRPSSPAENFEDEKYAELGPRVNKPAFFHPPFSFSRTSRSKGSSEEAEESEEKEDYVFPWYKDKENERKRRRYRGKIGEYEYPWERRERLAREKKRKRKGLTGGFHDDEDAEDTALNHRKLYPRGKYRFWSRVDRDASEEDTSDAVGSSSEQRPVGKYSSKYSAKRTKLPIEKKKTKGKSKSLEEISRSIKKALEGDSEEKKNDSYKNRGISRGIVPEDVTLEPIRRNKKKMKNSTSDIIDIENKNSTESLKNNSDDSEVQTTILKATAELKNSTGSSKKRRRPVKNAISNAENTLKSVDDSNRSRRRQKSGSTTPATTTSTTISTTSASRVVRRRNQKSVKDPKRIGKAVNQSNNGDGNGTETSTSKSRALGHRLNAVKGKTGEKKSPINEITDRSDKNAKREETLVANSDKMKRLDKSNKEQENNLENENGNKKSDDDSKKMKETSELDTKFSFGDDDEKFNFKDDSIEIMSDFDKSDDPSDEEFGSILKIDAGLTPKNRAVQLSEQESREVVSSVSWISENYNF